MESKKNTIKNESNAVVPPDAQNNEKPANRGSRFIPESFEELLAFEIAENFRDFNLLPMLTFYCKKYPLRVIWKAFQDAKKIPGQNIRKSRIALFIYLVHKYEKQSKSD